MKNGNSSPKAKIETRPADENLGPGQSDVAVRSVRGGLQWPARVWPVWRCAPRISVRMDRLNLTWT
jgi:hypothetical protein